VLSAASRDARFGAADSLDLLAATLATSEAMRLFARLDIDAEPIRLAALQRRSGRAVESGMSEDARAVIELALQRATQMRHQPEIEDILVGLATAECTARHVLGRYGVGEEAMKGAAGRG